MEMGPAAAPAVRDLAARLGDEEPRVRTAAARALSKTGSPAAVDPLAACLGDGERQVRLWCWKALRGLGDETIPALADMLVTGSEMRKLSYKDEVGRKRHWQDEVMERLATVGAPAVEPLAAKLAVEDTQLRGALFRVFSLMGAEAKGALPATLSILENTADVDTRVRAIQAIEKIGDLDPDVMPALKRAVGSKDKKVSAQATKTLRALEKAAKAKPKAKKKSPPRPKPKPADKPPI
jgi:HEAT repeat protein